MPARFGPSAVLHPGRHPALDQHQVRGGRHQAADDQADLNQGFDDDGKHHAYQLRLRIGSG